MTTIKVLNLLTNEEYEEDIPPDDRENLDQWLMRA